MPVDLAGPAAPASPPAYRWHGRAQVRPSGSGRDQPDTAQSAQHLPALDGVRGLAILAVLLVHLTWNTTDTAAERALTAIISCGWMGVDLFFVLSGFLITGILVDAKDSPRYFRSFYGRRALRILPLYYAFVTFMLVVLPYHHAQTPQLRSLLDHQGWLWAHAVNLWAARDGLGTLPYNVGIAWSLALEEQFYLVWPLVIRWVSRRALERICIGCIVGGLVVRLAIASRWPTAALTLMPARMDSLAMGGLVALIVRRPRGLEQLRRIAMPLGAIAIATIAVLFVVRGNMRALDYGLSTIGYASADWLSVAVLITALTFGAQAFSARPLRFLGRYSYSLYLFHLPVATALTPAIAWLSTKPPVLGTRFGWALLSFALTFGATLGLSLVSWVCLERPCLRLKSRLPYRASHAA